MRVIGAALVEAALGRFWHGQTVTCGGAATAAACAHPAPEPTTMKHPVLCLSLGLALATTASAIPAQEYVYMLSAGELRSLIDQGNRDMAIYYISGVMDAQMRAREFCVPGDTSQGVIGARAYTLMSQQPRESMAPAADVIAVYLHGDFPCRK